MANIPGKYLGIKELPKDYPGESTAVLIAYVVGRGWQLTTVNDYCVYTPQSFEATFGYLPKCPKGVEGVKGRQRREWYAHHRHQKDFKGFKPKNLKTKVTSEIGAKMLKTPQPEKGCGVRKVKG